MSTEIPDSLDTLLRIAERSPITPERRKKIIRNSVARSVSLGGFGVILGGGSVVSMIQAGVGPWNVVGTFIGGPSIIGGVVNCVKAYQVNQRYEQQLKSGEPFPEDFYLLDGQVSTQVTPIEITYGRRIIPVSSLDTLREAPSNYASGDLCFIDDVSVSGKSGEPTVFENESRYCDEEYSSTTIHRGELDFKRGGSKKTIHYVGHEPLEELFSGLLKHSGEKLALLFRPQSTGVVGSTLQFNVNHFYLMDNLT